jgi:hypothetical protein
MSTPKLLTLDDVFERTNIPKATWRWWRHVGKGPKFTRIGNGRRLYIAENDLNAWLAQQLDDGPEAA